MIICPNCGAEIENDVTKCPYCGYINIEGAEKKYFDELDDIKEDLAEVEKAPVKALRTGLSKGVRVILITVGVLLALAVLYVVMLFIETRDKPKIFLSAEEEAHAAAYRVIAGEQLQAAYDDGDIAKLAEIYDTAYSVERVSLWGDPHYETGYAASCYMKLRKCLPNLDKDKISAKEAEEITYYCFYFYYRAYGEDGAPLFDTVRDEEIMPIITQRLGFTIEDMENFRDQVMDPPNVNRSKVWGIVKNHYKDYR